MSHLLTYLIIKLDSISYLSSTIFILGLMFFVGLLIAYIGNKASRNSSYKAIRPWLITSTIVLCIGAFLDTVIPTTKQAAVIYLLPKIVNNEAVHELKGLPKDLAKLLNKKTNQWIDETLNLKKEKEE